MNKIPPIVRNIGGGVLLFLLLFFAYKFTLGKEAESGPLVEQGPDAVSGNITSQPSSREGDAVVIRDAYERLQGLSDIDTTILDSDVISSLKDSRIPLPVDELSSGNTGRDNPFAPTAKSSSSSAR